jgi:hypothetical protein
MSFMGGIFTGENKTLDNDINNAGNINSFSTATGEGAVQSGLGFEEGILSGDQAKQAQLLAPEIQNIQKQGQQQIQTAGEFGNRSGGVNASAQNNIDTQRSQVNNMVSQLTGNAAGAVMNEGNQMLNTGLEANKLQAGESQQKLENQQDSIVGQGIGTAVGAAEDAGLTFLGI